MQLFYIKYFHRTVIGYKVMKSSHIRIRVGVWKIIFFAVAYIFIMTGCSTEEKGANIGFVPMAPSLDIMSLAVYENKIYAGTPDGVYILKDNEPVLEKMNFERPISYVRALFVDSKNRLWIGSSEGITLVDSEGIVKVYDDTDLLPDKRVNTVYETKDGDLWIGTWGGAVLLDPSLKVKETFTVDNGLLKNMVNVIYEDAYKGIFFASYNERGGGISYLNTGTFTYFDEKDLININTTALYAANEDELWIGSGMLEEGGMTILSHWSGSWEVIRTMTMKDGLIGEKVRSMFFDGEKLYIGSEYDGITILNKDGTMEYLTEMNGLSHNEVKCYLMYDNKLYFGTKAGLCYLEK